VYIAPPGLCGTVVDGRDSWPAIWVEGLEGGPGGVLTGQVYGLPTIELRWR
jgi:hypothetical protein